MLMAPRNVTRNIVIANYGGSKEVDNDDGSLMWHVHGNFMAYGGWSCPPPKKNKHAGAGVGMAGDTRSRCLGRRCLTASGDAALCLLA